MKIGWWVEEKLCLSGDQPEAVMVVSWTFSRNFLCNSSTFLWPHSDYCEEDPVNGPGTIGPYHFSLQDETFSTSVINTGCQGRSKEGIGEPLKKR